jgi:DNA excision repair protein ERCC-4
VHLTLVYDRKRLTSSILQTIVESRALPRPSRDKEAQPTKEGIDTTSIHSKLVLLTLSFPRLRIIWSSSTQASVDIIADLKINHPEPDQAKAITIGGEEDVGEVGPDAAGGDSSGLFNTGPEEMLRCLPGVSSRNYKLISSRVATIRELCDVDDGKKMGEIVGSEDGGKSLFSFVNKDGR